MTRLKDLRKENHSRRPFLPDPGAGRRDRRDNDQISTVATGAQIRSRHPCLVTGEPSIPGKFRLLDHFRPLLRFRLDVRLEPLGCRRAERDSLVLKSLLEWPAQQLVDIGIDLGKDRLWHLRLRA